MALGLINDSTLTNIAEAIRSKTGTAASMTPSQMPDAIASIAGGGIDIDWENDLVFTATTTQSTLELPENYNFTDVKLAVLPVYGYSSSYPWLIVAPGTLTPEVITPTGESPKYQYFFPGILLGRPGYSMRTAGIWMLDGYIGASKNESSYPSIYGGIVSNDLHSISYVAGVDPTDPQTAFSLSTANYIIGNGNNDLGVFILKHKEEA